MWPSSAPPTGGWPWDQERCAVGRVPEVVHPVRGGLEHLDHVGAPELGRLAVVGQPDPGLFTGNAVADKDHAALVPGHAVAAVGDGPDVHNELGAGGGPGVGAHWMSCSFFASSDDFSCHGTLATITPGSKWSRVLIRSAVWLWTSCSHHLPTTYSGM